MPSGTVPYVDARRGQNKIGMRVKGSGGEGLRKWDMENEGHIRYISLLNRRLACLRGALHLFFPNA